MHPRIIFLAIVVVVAACGADVEQGPTDTAPSSSAPATAPSTSVTSPPATTSSTSGMAPADALDEAAAAFETWVGHLGAGDHQAAWEGMAPTSQASVGEELFFDSLVFAMSEGWGAWSVAEDVSYRMSEDEAGRTLLWVTGTVAPEGMTETREVAIPVVASEAGVLMSPFEEFGNVAEGIEEDLEGAVPPPVPDESGEGRRIVYSNSAQRVWLVEQDGGVVDSYLVSGKAGVPTPATYEVFSRSETALAGHDDITMRYMVRFAHGENLAIGFHAIPNDATGAPLQAEEELGEYRSAGCVRQSLQHAAFLYEWAPEGTPVVVLA
ncbi:MAG: L,D-transpeptidase [Acidimicrobiia bacterium]